MQTDVEGVMEGLDTALMSVSFIDVDTVRIFVALFPFGNTRQHSS